MFSSTIAGTVAFARAGAICVRDDHVLICRPPELDFWYLPGGRVHVGESTVEATVRELVEEIGTEPTSLELRWIVENFYRHEGEDHHEIGFYFKVDLPTAAEAFTWTAPFTRTEAITGQTQVFRWLPLAEIDRTDIRPRVVKRLLAEPVAGVRHVIHFDD